MSDSSTCVKRVPAMLLSCEGRVACIVRQQMELTYSNISVSTVVLIDLISLKVEETKLTVLELNFYKPRVFVRV